MRVAFYAATLMEIGGGLEKYFIETARDLSEISGVQADVLTMDDQFNLRYGRLHNIYFLKKFDPRLLYRESLESIQAKLGKARYIKSASFKELVSRAQRYDVVYSRNDITEPFFFKFLMRYRRVPPVVFGCHIPHVYPVAEKLHAKLHNFLFTCWLYNWMAAGVCGFHVVNQFTYDFLRRQFPGRRVRKIFYPFDFDAFAATADKNPFVARFPRDKFNILWVGRLVEQKGVEDMVALIDRVNAAHADRVEWNICGDGELKPLLEACRGRWKNVRAWGHVANAQMADAYRQSHLFVSTSKWESYPYNVLEAQALGVPTVTYDIAGCSDMIENGVNGFLARNLDDLVGKVSLLLQDNPLPPDGSQNLRRKIDRAGIYREMLEFFSECARNRAPGLPAAPPAGMGTQG